MTKIRETALPGFGLRFDFATKEGKRVGVVSHKTGRFELFVGGSDDPDAPVEMLELDSDERLALAEILGGSRIVEQLNSLQQHIEGLAIDWLPVAAASPYAGRTIGDTQARRRTGVSIVAILRDGTAVPAPGPDEPIDTGNVLVVVGTPEGIGRLTNLLRSS